MNFEGSSERLFNRSDTALLKIFCSVVECGGYSAAQAELNVSASNISMKMTALEQRLELRLCQRGRMGFSLTEEGRTVYNAAKKLFSAHNSFLEEVEYVKGHLSGSLNIAIIDATATNSYLCLAKTIGQFSKQHRNVYITMLVEEPSQIERKLLSGELDLGIAPFYHHIPNLEYLPLCQEPHSLYCGPGHKLFRRPPDEITRRDLERQPRAVRGYVPSSAPLFGKEHPAAATVFDMESMLHLILSGAFIGYVPCHFAERWVSADLLRPLRQDIFHHTSTIEVATRKGLSGKRILREFCDRLIDDHADFCGAR